MPFYVKFGLNTFAKNIDTRQPAQSTQADMGRTFSLSLICLHMFISLGYKSACWIYVFQKRVSHV